MREANKLVFVFRDGILAQRVWQDRSRVDSWTDEMKQAARDRMTPGAARGFSPAHARNQQEKEEARMSQTRVTVASRMIFTAGSVQREYVKKLWLPSVFPPIPRSSFPATRHRLIITPATYRQTMNGSS